MSLFGRKGKKETHSISSSTSKPKSRKIVWIIILLALPLGFLLKEVLQLHALQERSAILEKNKQQTQQEIANLEKEKGKLNKADPDTIEKHAREQLKYSRPGEVIYAPPEDKKKDEIDEKSK